MIGEYLWHWQGKAYEIVYEVRGEGSPVLLLPALSTVSTRLEVAALADALSSDYRTYSLDWLGFGHSARPPLEYRAQIYQQLLGDFVRDMLETPVAVVAAGHAASYAITLAPKQLWSKLALIAPTWRAPLRVMSKGAATWHDWVRDLVRSPIVGDTLYQLNTAPAFLRSMYQSHVYTDEANLTPEFIARKYSTTQQPNARYAPAAFVTGALDAVTTREELHAFLKPLPAPTLVVIAQDAPEGSREEMEALSKLPGVESVRLKGALGMYEEYPGEVAPVVRNFLQKAETLTAVEA